MPAVVVWAGVTKPGSRNDTRIQANDLYPTILRMLNLKRPEDHVIDGVDFSNALSGQKMERKPMFTYVPGHGNTPQWLPLDAVHHGDWKFIAPFTMARTESISIDSTICATTSAKTTT